MKCEECEKEIKTILMDGYGIGDRLLEGVMFIVDIETHKVLGVLEEHEDYFDDLNKEKWMKEAQDYADNHLDVGECPECHCDVDIPWFDYEARNARAKPIALTPLTFDGIQGKIKKKIEGSNNGEEESE